MHIDSVRALKQQLTAQLLTPLAQPIIAAAAAAAPPPMVARARAEIHVAAQSVGAVEPVQRTIALGIFKKGKNDFKLAVRVQRRALETSDYVERMRKAAKGEVDVQYVGRINKCATPWYRSHQRPIRPGCSIGHFKITAGTLGCFVTDAAGVTYILSNNHVLANENKAKPGDAILQQGTLDGGTNPSDRIGGLARFVRLKKTGSNTLDCALATIDPGVALVKTVKGIGAVKGLFAGDVHTGMNVSKVGRTTGLRRGRIRAFEIDNIVVKFEKGNLTFDDQIEIEGVGSGFADGGDSGSIILTDGLEGIALLFAASEQGGSNGLGLTYANPLGTVLQRLNVTLV